VRDASATCYELACEKIQLKQYFLEPDFVENNSAQKL
jgi:hypothetical protein